MQCCNLAFFITGRVRENTRQSRRVAVFEVIFVGGDNVYFNIKIFYMDLIQLILFNFQGSGIIATVHQGKIDLQKKCQHIE